jgi:hypothetical protein
MPSAADTPRPPRSSASASLSAPPSARGFDFGGGICSSLSVEKNVGDQRALFRLPGTIARSSDSAGFSAISRHIEPQASLAFVRILVREQ